MREVGSASDGYMIRRVLVVRKLNGAKLYGAKALCAKLYGVKSEVQRCILCIRDCIARLYSKSFATKLNLIALLSSSPHLTD